MADDLGQLGDSDTRSALVLVEPQWDCNGGLLWHGMTFAGGKVVNNITGGDRTVILEDCIDALAAAGIDVETEGLTDEQYDRSDGHA